MQLESRIEYYESLLWDDTQLALQNHEIDFPVRRHIHRPHYYTRMAEHVFKKERHCNDSHESILGELVNEAILVRNNYADGTWNGLYFKVTHDEKAVEFIARIRVYYQSKEDLLDELLHESKTMCVKSPTDIYQWLQEKSQLFVTLDAS